MNNSQELVSVATGLGITIPEKSEVRTTLNSAKLTVTEVSSSLKPIGAVGGKKITKM